MLPDWIDLCRLFDAHAVDYLLIGGQALDAETIIMLGREPFRIDLLTQIPGVEFDDAWKRRGSVSLDGVAVPLIAKVDLIANKKAVARPQDLADVAALEAVAAQR